MEIVPAPLHSPELGEEPVKSESTSPWWQNGAAHRPTEVRPGLFLGGLLSLGFLEELGLTHVLSVMDGGLGKGNVLGNIQHKHVMVTDVETTDILTHLPDCVQFVREALASGGRILVHCMAGISRSSTVVLAYLMTAEKLSHKQALAALRQVHSRANPNRGFLQQLKLFHIMKHKLDRSNWEYRNRLVLQRWKTDGIALSDFPDLDESSDHAEAALYRCRKCRRLLATSGNVAPEDLIVDSRAYPYFSKRCAPPDPEEEKTGLFVEPLRWMEDVSRLVRGKLHCPQCKARLGSFNWAGTQNSKGYWVTPAFQLHLDRLDVEPPASAAPALNVRQPALS